MRVCFDGLCFASRRPAVEQETQTVLCGATALDAQQLGRLLKYTNFASPAPTPRPPASDAAGRPAVLTSGPAAKKTASAASTASVSAHGFASADRTGGDTGSSTSSSATTSVSCERSATASVSSARDRDRDGPAMMGDHGTSATAAAAAAAATNDTVNNNLDTGAVVNSYKQLAQLQGDQQVQSILQNLFIGDADALGLSPQVQELLKVVQAKDIRIRELEDLLRQKHDEVAELRSHLDKFQSVFRTSGGATGVSPGGRKLGTHGGVQRQRAQGISAEPQSESSVLELMHVTFPKYDKEERILTSSVPPGPRQLSNLALNTPVTRTHRIRVQLAHKRLNCLSAQLALQHISVTPLRRRSSRQQRCAGYLAKRIVMPPTRLSIVCDQLVQPGWPAFGWLLLDGGWTSLAQCNELLMRTPLPMASRGAETTGHEPRKFVRTLMI
ncbi:AGAP008865-PA-like protein [Anopheles sinensis]|uniref:AGAP008865-PA-like protein n=1 Tax=Anopheles sinensis TaxID=74873 RepID=A0A084VYL1_ANOSI|nr:AGAP008865-PA-like protein [Anopheles sinensis]